ncbi:MAG: T9SS type A sorting domain-containing protein [Bacteroidetes bacterium]|nr:T9SS type A sorting domain-containing protein [Bacteroidota bacterium]
MKKLILISLVFFLPSGQGLLAQTIAGSRYMHSVATCTDGSVMTWGDNSSGAIGDNTTTNASSPVQVHGPGNVGFLSNIISLGAGRESSLALKNDSTVWAWGNNFYKQLGDGSATNRLTPVQVLTGASGCVTYLCKIIAISCATYHTLALKSDGTVWAWGNNGGSFGKLGINDIVASTKSTPVQVHGAGNVGFLSGIKAISGGGNHSLALKSDGTVWAWGYNSNGQLGDNITTNQPVPVQVVGAGGSGNLTNIAAIAGGIFHSLAIDNTGQVWAWGSNVNGELGNGTTTESHFPVQVSGLSNIISIAAGQYFSVAVKNDSTVWAWGDNTFGQLGIGSQTSGTLVIGKTYIISNYVATDDFTNVGDCCNFTGDQFTATGTTPAKWSYGSTLLIQHEVLPVQVKGVGCAGNLLKIASVAAGQYHALALKSNNTLKAWGDDFEGQLGNNTTSTQFPCPVQVGSGGGNALCSVAILPVELLSFNARCENEKINCEWSTATEINNDYFSVERSADGKSWEEVGKIKGAGNSSTQKNYEFTDETLYSSPATLYYRLKQVDFNGKYEYYGPISAQCQPTDEWNLILENIFSDEELKGTLISPENSEVTLSIIDLQGRIINYEKINAEKGSNFFEMDLNKINAGIYFLRVSSEKNMLTKKFVKQ